MLGLYIAAVVAAALHHAFASHLNGHIVSTVDVGWEHTSIYSQRGASAISTAFAFAVKTCLGGAIGVAFVQCVWHIVQRRWNSIQCINTLFAGQSDLFAALSLSFVRSARASAFLVMALWALPVVVVLTPGSLGIGQRTDSVTSLCAVPTFDSTRSYPLFSGTYCSTSLGLIRMICFADLS